MMGMHIRRSNYIVDNFLIIGRRWSMIRTILSERKVSALISLVTTFHRCYFWLLPIKRRISTYLLISSCEFIYKFFSSKIDQFPGQKKREMANVSPDLQWQVIRKTSSFIRRQRGIPKHFSTEKFNLKGVNSIRFNGLIHKKAIDIRPTNDNKAIVISTKIRSKHISIIFLRFFF